MCKNTISAFQSIRLSALQSARKSRIVRSYNMGLLSNLFGKKADGNNKVDYNNPADNINTADNTRQDIPEFVFGVEDTFRLQNSNDLVVVGRVKGTVVSGTAVYIHGWSDEEKPITLTTVKEIEINKQLVSQATDCLAGLRLEGVAGAGIKIGSVLATRNISAKDVHTAYVNAIGNSYVWVRQFNFSDEEISMMSITDMAEAWRLYLHAAREQSVVKDDPQTQRQKIDRLAKKMVEKVLAQKEMNIVYSTLTGEPFLFSTTIDNKDGTYKCMPPEVMMITRPYLVAYKESYSKNGFEIKTISNNEDGKGIYNFFGSSFYMDGACALRINGQDVGIMAEEVVPAPNYEGMPEINIPVTNPDLLRWILLMGQMGEPEKGDGELIYGLYYSFFLRELPKAKLLIPMKHDIPIPNPDENGETVLQKDTKIQFPTLPGKEGRDAVRMYTDWKMLRKSFGEEWSAMIQPVSGMIEVMDCAINVTDHPAAGCYVNKTTFEETQKKA
jgi:hypothetical protein